MAQFDVYRNPGLETRESIPYLLDVQNALLDALATRIVVPLVRRSVMPRPAEHLNPAFNIEGEPVVMSTAELAGISRHALGERVGSLAEHRSEIVSAIDFLVTGI
ncbi:MAG: plasmid maintenance protein CcdB [Desulfuromonas sp.]|uniref:CcdB family protein n=1 Tax=Desulfuromonas sp. TaxID=892 RepID=UPI000CCAD6CB|nr:CcdB family protein [Desulfuromonas sp.]PLX85520.1 MAG: plasmid maintenance protein CcdB [Desulfuromonas sp.]